MFVAIIPYLHDTGKFSKQYTVTEFSLMFTYTVSNSIHFHFLYSLFLHYMSRPMYRPSSGGSLSDNTILNISENSVNTRATGC
jgi:CRISPR/Cas system-associated endonuclease Cas3-HD